VVEGVVAAMEIDLYVVRLKSLVDFVWVFEMVVWFY